MTGATPGGASFGSVTLPDTTKTIEVDGTAAGGGLGFALIGIGSFFGTPGGLVATATVAGAAYGFKAQSPVGGITTAGSADDSIVGPTADQYGATVGFLGPLGNSLGALTIGAPGGKYVDVNLGTAQTGPFLGPMGGAPAPSVRFTDTTSGNSFGVVNIGGGIGGTSQVTSFIGGDQIADLVVAGQGEALKPFYLINGARLAGMSGTIDVSVAQPGPVPAIVRVEGKFPSDWSTGFTEGAAIVDLNGDGYGDFAIGETVASKPGRIAVFY